MKRLFICIMSIMALATLSTIRAEEKQLNSEQQALRSDVMNFLREEGYMPEIDSDGDVKFKKEGRNYYVSVSAKDESPMYLSLYVPYNYPDDYSLETVVMATRELNLYKGVKVKCYKTTFEVAAELYLRDAELFKECFYKLMQQLEYVRSDFTEECKNASAGSSSLSLSGLPFIITKMEVANTDENDGIIQDYGSTIYDYKTKYLKPKITVKPLASSGSYTVYVKLYQSNSLSTGDSSPAGYSYSNSVTLSGSSAQVFTLSGWGSKTAGHWSAGTYRFEVWYGDYCIGSKTFKII